MSLADHLNLTVVITRQSTTASSGGGKSIARTPVYSDLPMMIQPLSGGLVEKFARLEKRVSHVGYTDQEIHVKPGDRLSDNTGRNFTIRSDADQAGMGEVFAVYLSAEDQ